MGGSSDDIDRQIKETSEPIDENLGVLEERGASSAVRYRKIAAVIVGALVVAGAGVLIYRRMNRPTRPERLRSMLMDALKDLPDSLRELPDEVASRLKAAPAVVGTASTAVIERFTRSSDPQEAHSRSTVSERD